MRWRVADVSKNGQSHRHVIHGKPVEVIYLLLHQCEMRAVSAGKRLQSPQRFG